MNLKHHTWLAKNEPPVFYRKVGLGLLRQIMTDFQTSFTGTWLKCHYNARWLSMRSGGFNFFRLLQWSLLRCRHRRHICPKTAAGGRTMVCETITAYLLFVSEDEDASVHWPPSVRSTTDRALIVTQQRNRRSKQWRGHRLENRVCKDGNGSWVMGHGSNGSPFWMGHVGHCQLADASDPLTHDDKINAQ